MVILGIGDHISCGTALIRDGKMEFAITDERLVREKMVFGMPRESIRMILKDYVSSPDEIDAVAIATENQHIVPEYTDFKDGWFGLKRSGFKDKLFRLASNVSKLRAKAPFIDKIYYAVRQPAFNARRAEWRRVLKQEFGINAPVHFIDHHFCHITSAYYTSGFRDATVFSIDGGGDGKSGKVYDVTDGKFTELLTTSSFDSIGAFYSYITQICGYKAGRHEGKITGLAAYGEPRYIPQLQKILKEENGHIKNVGNVFFWSALRELQKLIPPDFKHKDLAASVQNHTEQMVVALIEYWVKQTGHRNVALAGGVCANVKINQRINESAETEQVYIHPGMSDEGMPVGAALALYYELSGEQYDPDKITTMEHVYLGPEFSDEEIKAELDKEDVKATYHDDVEVEIAKLLADNKVVARFDGRMEYGPRALCNRTIMYPPTDPTLTYWLNEALDRTEFMPFAPVVLKEYEDECFIDMDGTRETARFMTITYDCTEDFAKKCPGVVHVDNTARPQTVSEKDNPSAYKVLREFHKLTGLPAIINTSFNMHEEPIVCTPYDAIRAFKLGHIDYLAIGHWIAKNENPVQRNNDDTQFMQGLEKTGFDRVY